MYYVIRPTQEGGIGFEYFFKFFIWFLGEYGLDLPAGFDVVIFHYPPYGDVGPYQVFLEIVVQFVHWNQGYGID